MDHMAEVSKPKPSIYLSDEDANKFDDYDVDDSFTITAKVRVASKSKRAYKSNGKVKKSMSIDLELSNIKISKDLESKLEGVEF